MPEIPVYADFLNDVRGQLASRLRLSGHTIPASFSVDDVALRYWDYKWRQIPARPRTVVKSRELAEWMHTADQQAGLDAIIEDTEAGLTLGPYFSKRWMNLESHDILFNEWHVRHMHLGGRTVDPDGFVKRTGPVLFVYITPDKLYMIDIMKHGKGHPTTFAKRRIVQILHDNWPELIVHAKAEGCSNFTPNDDESRRILSRRAKGTHFALCVEVDEGTVYTFIGCGYMSDGRNMLARMLTNQLLTHAYELQKWVNSSPPYFQTGIEQRIGVLLDELHFRLELKHIPRGIEIGIRETQSKHLVLHGRKLGFPLKP